MGAKNILFFYLVALLPASLLVESAVANDCSAKYESLLTDYDRSTDNLKLGIKICDKAGDKSSECFQVHQMAKTMDAGFKPLLKYLDKNCGKIYDDRFKVAIKTYSDTATSLKTRDPKEIIWRGCKKREVIRDNAGNIKSVKCKEK